MNILRIADEIDRIHRQLKASGAIQTMADAAANYRSAIGAMGGTDAVRQLIEQQQEMMRGLIGHRHIFDEAQATAERLRAEHDALLTIPAYLESPFAVAPMAPGVELCSPPELCFPEMAAPRRVHSDHTDDYPRRSIVRPEVRRKIGF